MEDQKLSDSILQAIPFCDGNWDLNMRLTSGIFHAAIAVAAVGAVLPEGPSSSKTHRNEYARRMLGSSFGIPKNQTFDYLVIGGGTAGLTIATRLAEQGVGSVAVIEAGGFYELNNGNLSQIPAQDAFYVGTDLDDWQPGIDWGFHTTPQAVSCPSRIMDIKG